MATKKIGVKTTRQMNGKKSSSKVSAKELNAVNSVCDVATAEAATIEVPTIGGGAVVVPASVGVTAGGCDPAPVAAGAEGTLQPVKVRQSAASQVASSEVMEGDAKLIDLRKKIVSVFAVPEWEGRQQLVDSLSALVLAGVMTDEQKESAVAAADRKAGVTTPICSVPRVLAVARHYSKEIENVLGVSFESIVNYYRKNGAVAVSFVPRLSFNAVRADSVLSNFVDSVPVPAGASASAVVSAVFSVRHAIEFNRLVSRANNNAVWDCKYNLSGAIRSAQRVGWSLDDVLNFVRHNWEGVRLSDSKERETLRKNNINAWAKINEINNLILSSGGAACVDGLGGCDASDKHAAKVRKLLARRARFASVAATTEALIAR